MQPDSEASWPLLLWGKGEGERGGEWGERKRWLERMSRKREVCAGQRGHEATSSACVPGLLGVERAELDFDVVARRLVGRGFLSRERREHGPHVRTRCDAACAASFALYPFPRLGTTETRQRQSYLALCEDLLQIKRGRFPGVRGRWRLKGHELGRRKSVQRRNSGGSSARHNHNQGAVSSCWQEGACKRPIVCVSSAGLTSVRHLGSGGSGATVGMRCV